MSLREKYEDLSSKESLLEAGKNKEYALYSAELAPYGIEFSNYDDLQKKRETLEVIDRATILGKQLTEAADIIKPDCWIIPKGSFGMEDYYEDLKGLQYKSNISASINTKFYRTQWFDGSIHLWNESVWIVHGLKEFVFNEEKKNLKIFRMREKEELEKLNSKIKKMSPLFTSELAYQELGITYHGREQIRRVAILLYKDGNAYYLSKGWENFYYDTDDGIHVHKFLSYKEFVEERFSEKYLLDEIRRINEG